jgi:glycosyltransferase involved in cell wall biosynthesis
MARVFVYDPVMDRLGGAQKCAAMIASRLSRDHEVSLAADRPLADYERAYGTDLTRVRPAPLERDPAPRSGEFDLFLATESTPWVRPRARRNVMLCQFPFPVQPIRAAGRRTPRLFDLNAALRRFAPWIGASHRNVSVELPLSKEAHLDAYDRILANSAYGAEWIRRLWKVDAHVLHLFSNLEPLTQAKEHLVLSVSRLDPPKKQAEMIQAFDKMPPGWRFVVAGATTSEAYVRRLRRVARGRQIDLVLDPDHETIRALYARARIFWHMTGWGVRPRRNPIALEHFGLVVVEAMQSGCVPVVFDGGGHRDIVTPGSGFLVRDDSELRQRTRALMEEPGDWSAAARARAEYFSVPRFEERLLEALAPFL